MTYGEEPYERVWWRNRADTCTCGAWRMPYKWCDDGCTFLTPDPDGVMTPATMRGVPNTPGTPRRTIRVPDPLWDAAQTKAQERGESVSDVIRKALERYVKRR